MEMIYNLDDTHFQITDQALGLEFNEEYINQRCFPKFTADPQEYTLIERELGNGVTERFLMKGRARWGQNVVIGSNGNLQSETFYKENKLHGPSRHFCIERQQLLAQGWFVDGAQQGRNFQYFPDGLLYSETQYCDGQLQGLQTYYFPSGQVKASIPYCDGQLHGAVEQYFSNGALFRRVHFHNNMREGLEEQFGPDGKPAFMCYYSGDCPVKESKSWHSCGTLCEHFRYKDAAWRYDLDKFDEQGHQWLEGRFASDSHYEEKIFSKTGRLTEHKIYSRKNSQWSVSKVIMATAFDGV